MDAIAETFEDVDLLIWDVCHQFVKRYGGDLQEARSSANESFLIAYKDWDPTSTMQFSTYVRKVVWDRFRDEARRYAVKYGREPVMDTTEMDPTQPATSNDWRSRCVSTDAEEVVDLLVEPEFKDFRTKLKRQKKKTKLQYLIDFLRDDRGWDDDRIDNACDEIYQVLL